jgi:tetratricopeptide (TPR) repeat protein
MLKTIEKQYRLWGLALLMVFFASNISAQSALRAEIHQPLVAAQQALQAQRSEEAMKLLADLGARSDLSGEEKLVIWRMQAVAAMRTENWELAAKRLEALLDLPQAPSADKLVFSQSLVKVGLEKKDPKLTAQAARRFLSLCGEHDGVHLALVQSLALMDDHDALVQTMASRAQSNQARGRKTPEAEWRVLASSHKKRNDSSAYYAVLKKLVTEYPSPAYWADAVARMTAQPGFHSRYLLEAYRLLMETGNVRESAELLEMIELARKAGLPAEARRLMEWGYAKELLGQGDQAGAHEKLRANLIKMADEDLIAIVQLERAANDGKTWMAIGDAYASQQQWVKANTAYAKAIDIGGVHKDAELKLRYGVSLAKSGKIQQAHSLWKGILGDASAAEIAFFQKLLHR